MSIPNGAKAGLPVGYTLERRDPAKLESGELAALLHILEVGAAVSVLSAEYELPRSTSLVLLLHECKIIGLGSIKQEREWYANDVQSARKGDFTFDSKTLELGYVVVSDDHGGKHLSGYLADALLADYPGDLFATTDHPRMKTTLGKRGFVPRGKEWEGSRGTLSLWLRQASQYSA